MANAPVEETVAQPRPFDPITGLRYLHFAKTAYPELYNELGFDKILAAKGARRWDPDDPGFVAALEEFTHRFLDFLKYHPEAAKEFEVASPREMVERISVEAKRYPDIRARELAQKYVAEAQKRGFAIANEEAVSRALAESLARASEKSATAEDLPRQTKAEIAKRSELITQVEPQVLTEIIDERREELASDRDKVSDITRDAFTAGVARPDVYARIKTSFLAENPKINPVTLGKEAERLTNVATALLADFGPQDRDRLTGFFQAFAKTGVQQGLAPAADFALGFFDKEKQQTIADLITGKAFARAAEPKNLEASLGAAAHSSTITGLKADGQRVFGQPKPLAEHNLIKRWLAAGLTGPIGENLAGKPDQVVTDVFKLAALGVFADFVSVKPSPGTATQKLTLTSVGRAHASGVAALAWNTLDLYLAAAYQRLPTGFHLDFSAVSGWLLGRGAREAGKQVAGQVVGAGAKGTVAKIIGLFLGTAAGGPVGLVVGWLGGEAVTRIFGALTGRIKNFFTALVTGAPGFSFDRDLPLFVAIIVVGILPIFIFPFLPFNNLIDTVRTTAFVTSVEQAVGGGTFGSKNIAYNGPLPPASLISRCPVTGGTISQGPGQGTHVSPTTGALIDAYDIAVGTGTNVYPAHSGYVVSYEDLPISTTNFGKYVRLVGTTSDGQKYFTTYAHLLSVSPQIVEAARQGKLVTPETLLGQVDNTGNSTGPHLHFEYDGPGTMTLPAGCAGT